eukprot:1157754-Pelagomonas_calceolata.AAC.10
MRSAYAMGVHDVLHSTACMQEYVHVWHGNCGREKQAAATSGAPESYATLRLPFGVSVKQACPKAGMPLIRCQVQGMKVSVEKQYMLNSQ